MNAIGIFILTMAVTFTYIAAYFILKKRRYLFVTGLRNRSKEEIKKLEKTGFIKATGKLYLATAIILTIGLFLTLFGITYAFEISIGVVLLLFVIGYIYIQKYELKERRKSAYLSSFITAFITIGIVGFVISRGLVGNDLNITESQVEISGPYGVDFAIQEMEHVKLLQEFPKINVRTNGYAIGDRLMGNFNLEKYGSGKLYIHGENAPYLFIELHETYILINSKDSRQTELWFEELEEKIH